MMAFFNFIKKNKKVFSLGLIVSQLFLADAKALVTHQLEYTRLDGVGTLSGTFIFDETSVTFGNFVSNAGSNGLPSWVNSLTIVYNDGSSNTTFNSADFRAVGITSDDEAGIDYSSNLVPQLTNLQFFGMTPAISTGGNFIQNIQPNNDFQLTSTPSPLPLLGIAFMPLGVSLIKKKNKNLLYFGRNQNK